ncbi:MAG: C25 family cysteine peptidase [Saprospiraceae bacterium]
MDTANHLSINTYDFVETSQNPKLNIRYATNGGSHLLKFYINDEYNSSFTNYGFYCNDIDIELKNQDIQSTMPIVLRGTDNSDILDRNSVAILALTYAREFKFFNSSFFEFNIENTVFNTYYEIEDFDMSGSEFALYDVTNNLRLIPVLDNDNKLVKFKLLTTQNKRDLILINLSKSIKNISSIQKVNFIDFSNYFDKNYLIISNKEKFNNGTGNVVDDYIEYRQSTQGGGFKILEEDIQNIYDQFGYGINRYSQAMNNFIMYYNDYFSSPEYVLVIGKGLEYPEIRTDAQLTEQKNVFIIPTYGYPGSDNLMASRLNNNHQELALGRIAARDADQLDTYLEKVKRYEDKDNYAQTLEDKLWMKKIIHLVGGSTMRFD